MRFRQFLPIVVLLALIALAAIAGDNRWTIKGPDGGTVNKLAFDPVNPSIAYAASANGIFRSADGGQHWVAAAALLGTPFSDLAVANSDPQKIFASSVYGLYKSTDRGTTWFQVHPFASFAVAVSRTNADIVYSDSTGGPFRSSDGGVTFANVGSGLPSPPSAVSVLAIDPQTPDTVYASYQTSAGVYKSVDGGAHWAAANTGLAQSSYYSLIIDPSNSSTLYVGARGEIYKTTDGGASWTALQTDLSLDAFYYSLSISVAVSPSTIVAGTSRGMIKTTTGGSNWTAALGLGQTDVTAVAIDPLDAANVLALAFLSLSRSVSGGANFTPANSGLTAHYTQAIAVDPRDASIVYASGPAGIFKSTDRGETWSGSANFFANHIAVDPFDSLTLYAIFSGTFSRSTGGSVFFQSFSAGLPLGGSATVIATDAQVPGTLYTIVGNALYKKVGNDPWVNRSTGLPAGGFPSFIVIDPHNSSTLYTGGSGTGVFKSVDGGANWAPATGGLSGVSPGGLAVDPFDSTHLLTWANSSGYESTDGGANWVPFATTAGRQSILLAFDATAPGRVYNSSFDAVDRSADGGKTWFPLLNGLGRAHGNLFVIAPGGSTLYTGGASGGVWAYTFVRQRAVSK